MGEALVLAECRGSGGGGGGEKGGLPKVEPFDKNSALKKEGIFCSYIVLTKQVPGDVHSSPVTRMWVRLSASSGPFANATVFLHLPCTAHPQIGHLANWMSSGQKVMHPAGWRQPRERMD